LDRKDHEYVSMLCCRPCRCRHLDREDRGGGKERADTQGAEETAPRSPGHGPMKGHQRSNAVGCRGWYSPTSPPPGRRTTVRSPQDASMTGPPNSTPFADRRAMV